LGTFILNLKKKSLAFCYEENKVKLQDFIVESCTKVLSLEYIDHIQNSTIQRDNGSPQQSYEELEELRKKEDSLVNKLCEENQYLADEAHLPYSSILTSSPPCLEHENGYVILLNISPMPRL
jgi:hypothetical protein